VDEQISAASPDPDAGSKSSRNIIGDCDLSEWHELAVGPCFVGRSSQNSGRSHAKIIAAQRHKTFGERRDSENMVSAKQRAEVSGDPDLKFARTEANDLGCRTSVSNEVETCGVEKRRVSA